MYKSIINCVCLFLFCFTQVEALPKQEVFQEEILFQEVPLLIKGKMLTIYVYNPADSLLGPLQIPFMEIEIQFDDTGAIKEAELSELGRTEGLNGSQLIELVKYLQIYYGIPKIEVTDVSHTLSCPMEGILCHHEAIHRLSPITVYLSGKSYYERGGAVPLPRDGEEVAYRTAADFLYQGLRIDQFIKDLQSVQGIFPKASALANFIQEAVVVTRSSDTDRISELFTRVRAEANQNASSHQMWHAMLDRLVGMEGNFLLEFSNEVLASQEVYPEVVRHFCAHSILEYVDEIIRMNGFPNDLKLNSTEAKREYFFDHQKEFYEAVLSRIDQGQNAYEDDEEDEDDDDDDEEESILDATWKYRSDKEILKNNMKKQFVYFAGLREAYGKAKGYWQVLNPVDDRDSEDEDSDDSDDDDYFRELDNEQWIELAQWIKVASVVDGPKGQVYLMWQVANRIILHLNLFEFIHPNYIEEKNADAA